MARPLTGLTRRNLVRELMAGVTLLAIAIPLNIGYAQIAGLPPTAGLYALIVPTVVYALDRVVAPAGGLAGCRGGGARGVVDRRSRRGRQRRLRDARAGPGASSAVSMFVLLAVFKLGFLANFLSKPILVGFVGGLALDILVSQVAKMLGVKIDSGGEFVDKVAELVAGLDDGQLGGRCSSRSSRVAVLLLGRRFARARAVGARRPGRRHHRWWSSPTSTTPAWPCSARCEAGSARADLADHRLDDVARPRARRRSR